MTQYITSLYETGSPSADLQQIGKSVCHLFPGWKVHLFDSIDSTNTEARRLGSKIGGDAWPRVLLADVQTEGRGRQGKSWDSPANTSLLATIMIPQTLFKVQHALISWAVACWCLEGLERQSLKQVGLKWPNDLLVNGQKIGGILCEQTGAAIIMGVGVNLEQEREHLPTRPVGVPQATSLKLELGDSYPGRFSASFSILTSLLESIEHPSSSAHILAQSRKKCASLGQAVSFTDPILGAIAGEAIHIDDDGGLVLDVPKIGQRKAWIPFSEEA